MPEIDPNGRTYVIQNDKPVIDSVATRNSDSRIWLPAGKAYRVILETEDHQKLIASGTSRVKTGEFCLQVRTRITDESNTPPEIIVGP